MSFEILFSLVFIAAGSFLALSRFHLFSLKSLNAIQVMFVSHVLTQIIPAMLLTFDKTLPEAQTFLLYNTIAAILIPLGGLSADLFFPKGSISKFYRRPIANTLSDRKIFLRFFLVYFGFCAFIFVAYVSKAPAMPLANLVSGASDYSAHALARREATSQGLIYGIALRFFMPFLFVLSVIGFSYFKTRSTRLFLFAAASMALLYNAWPGSKVPVAILFLLTLTVISISSGERASSVRSPAEVAKARRKRRRFMLFMILGLIGYPFVIYLFTPIGRLGFQFILEQIFARIFFKPALNSYYAFEMFSDQVYTHFSDVKKWAALTGQEYFPLSTEISYYKGYDVFSNSPPAAIGNFYAQGGPTVVVVGVLVAAFMFRFAENIFRLSAIKTPVTITCMGFLVYGAFRFSWANFHTLIMSELFVPMAFVLGMFSLFQRARQNDQQRVNGNLK